MREKKEQQDRAIGLRYKPEEIKTLPGADTKPQSLIAGILARIRKDEIDFGAKGGSQQRMTSSTSLERIIELLEGYYGRPAPPTITEPLEIILLENIAYLVDDRQRERAFAALRAEVGTEPGEILSAPMKKLLQVAALGGMRPEARVGKLREIAMIALGEFGGDLGSALRQLLTREEPLAQAKKSLKKFPGIGEPGAEKILLFTKSFPILALESNGLRVLLRLGFGQEHKNYSTGYRSVQKALQDQVGDDCAFLISAYQLLRRHGKELCRTNHPACELCPLNQRCRYYLERRPKGPDSTRKATHTSED